MGGRGAVLTDISNGGPPRHRRAVLTVAIGAIALETMLLGVITPLLPEIEERTGTWEAALGLALAAYATPTVLFSIPVGRSVDRAGRRTILLSGLLLTAVGSLANCAIRVSGNAATRSRGARVRLDR